MIRLSKTYFCVELLVFVVLCFSSAYGGITYDRQSKAIVVVDYPKGVPCRPRNLLLADRMNNWNVITYDEYSDCYELKANLQIGDNNNTHTYFQVGDSEQLTETLHVKGNVILYPEYVRGENESKGRDWINSLTVGLPDNRNCRAVLRILNGEKSKHSIYVSRIPLKKGGFLHKTYTAFGGDFNIYNSVVGGVTVTSKMGQPLLYGRRIIFDNAIIENFEGCFTSGCFAHLADIKGTIFQNGDSAMRNPGFNAYKCEFRNLKTAISEVGGPVKAVLSECIFKDNFRNILLRYRGSAIRLVDCSVFQAKLPSECNSLSRGSLKTPPAILIFQNKQLFQVNGLDGAPIVGANIKIAAEQASSSIYNRTASNVLSDSSGRAVVLLTTKSLSKDNNIEKKTNYTYRVKVDAKGYLGQTIVGFHPVPKAKPFVVNMQKKQKNKE